MSGSEPGVSRSRLCAPSFQMSSTAAPAVELISQLELITIHLSMLLAKILAHSKAKLIKREPINFWLPYLPLRSFSNFPLSLSPFLSLSFASPLFVFKFL